MEVVLSIIEEGKTEIYEVGSIEKAQEKLSELSKKNEKSESCCDGSCNQLKRQLKRLIEIVGYFQCDNCGELEKQENLFTTNKKEEYYNKKLCRSCMTDIKRKNEENILLQQDIEKWETKINQDSIDNERLV